MDTFVGAAAVLKRCGVGVIVPLVSTSMCVVASIIAVIGLTGPLSPTRKVIFSVTTEAQSSQQKLKTLSFYKKKIYMIQVSHWSNVSGPVSLEPVKPVEQ